MSLPGFNPGLREPLRADLDGVLRSRHLPQDRQIRRWDCRRVRWPPILEKGSVDTNSDWPKQRGRAGKEYLIGSASQPALDMRRFIHVRLSRLA